MVRLMEEKARYGIAPTVLIRPETLSSAKSWVHPTPEEVKEVLVLAQLNLGTASEFLGLTPQSATTGKVSRSMRRWTDGATPIPYAAWALLVHKAGLGQIWE